MSHIGYAYNGTTRMTATRQYDNLNRLLHISSSPSADAPFSFGYQYNDVNQRTRVDTADSAFWSCDYDDLGQLTSGKKYWSDSTPVAGQQFEYSYDDIGNRTQTRSGGDSLGGGLRTANYTNNNLNQLTSRGVPGTIDVIGTALPGASVTVNSQATSRKDNYFHAAVPVSNTATNAYQSIAISASQTPASVSSNGNVFLPQNPEILKYDADGNLTNDGRWVLTWDAENRLVRMTGSNVVDVAKKTIVFTYDWRGRRAGKVVSNYVSGAWQLASSHTFIYDGWNVFGITGTGGNRWFTWGTDLSGSAQGAGGVGGLLGMVDSTQSPSTNYCFAYDGNGNVAGMLNAQSGVTAAQYEYDPFGNVLRATGIKAFTNPFRFSTKFQDDESGWSYYGYRYYAPSIGKWVSRDPLGESVGANLNVFSINNPVNLIDSDGRIVPVLLVGAGIGAGGKALINTYEGMAIGAIRAQETEALDAMAQAKGFANYQDALMQLDKKGDQMLTSGNGGAVQAAAGIAGAAAEAYVNGASQIATAGLTPTSMCVVRSCKTTRAQIKLKKTLESGPFTDLGPNSGFPLELASAAHRVGVNLRSINLKGSVAHVDIGFSRTLTAEDIRHL